MPIPIRDGGELVLAQRSAISMIVRFAKQLADADRLMSSATREQMPSLSGSLCKHRKRAGFRFVPEWSPIAAIIPSVLHRPLFFGGEERKQSLAPLQCHTLTAAAPATAPPPSPVLSPKYGAVQ